MNNDITQELSNLPTDELELIVHRGENLHIPTSKASQAQRILESRRHTELVKASQKPDSKDKIISPNDLIIFYSWQSDLPNKTNRGLIEEALEMAVKRIRQDSSIKIIPRLDKDTSGVPGSPNIATTILDKIDNSFLIVSDVSIINSGDKSRPTPNPNVLYELGYAVKSLGMNNIVMVQNTTFGDFQDLPFDLRYRRVLPYSCNPSGNVSEARKDLTNKLEYAIRLALNNVEPKTPQVTNTEIEQLYKEEVEEAGVFFESNLKSDGGFLELLVHPNTYNPDLIKNPVEAGNIVEQSVVSLRGWDFPHIDRHGNISNFNKGKQSFTISEDIQVQEGWRMYKSGLFVRKDYLREDLRGFEEDNHKVLFFVSTIYLLTEIMIFLKTVYAEKLKVESIRVEFVLNGCKGRMLGEGQPGLLHRGYVCNEDQIKVAKNVKTADLESSPESMARIFIKEIFMLFNWNDPLESMLEDWQKKLLNRNT